MCSHYTHTPAFLERSVACRLNETLDVLSLKLPFVRCVSNDTIPRYFDAKYVSCSPREEELEGNWGGARVCRWGTVNPGDIVVVRLGGDSDPGGNFSLERWRETLAGCQVDLAGNEDRVWRDEWSGWREDGGKEDSSNQVIVLVETEKLEGELAWLEKRTNSRQLVVIPITMPKLEKPRENETLDLFVFLQLCSCLSIQPAVYQSPRFFPVTTDWRELQKAGKKGGNDV